MWIIVENVVTPDAVSTKTTSLRVEIVCGRLLRTSFAHTDQHAHMLEIAPAHRADAIFCYENVKLMWNTCR